MHERKEDVLNNHWEKLLSPYLIQLAQQWGFCKQNHCTTQWLWHSLAKEKRHYSFEVETPTPTAFPGKQKYMIQQNPVSYQWEIQRQGDDMKTAHGGRCNGDSQKMWMGFSKRMKGFRCPSSLRWFWGTEMQANGLLASALLLLMRSCIPWETEQTQKQRHCPTEMGLLQALHPWTTFSSPYCSV